MLRSGLRHGDSGPRSRGKLPSIRSGFDWWRFCPIVGHDVGVNPGVLRHGPNSEGPLGEVIVPRDCNLMFAFGGVGCKGGNGG